jgi:hypothetical protein
LKCGFSEGVVNELENEKFKISISYYDGWIFRYREKSEYGSSDIELYPCNIYYLHQLQNLYFALTNEELEINL